MTIIVNHQIAQQLRQMADVLLQQGDRGFRPAAYGRAADTVDGLNIPVSEVLSKEGIEGLIALPTIGEGIAGAIAEILATGKWAQLDRLVGSLDPEATFQLVPGIGPQLAERIHEGLGIDTLQQLELAAHDGRLEQLQGINRRRAAEIRGALNELLGGLKLEDRVVSERPPVGLLLEVDAAYRRKAAAGILRVIAPRRFNPKGKAWLPVMHAEHGRWRFTALFSNTARAHKLGRTSDWVIIYSQTETAPEVQSTVVTETTGLLKGKRVVRGREPECTEHYERAGMEV